MASSDPNGRFVDPDQLLQQAYEEHLAKLRAELAAATTWRQRRILQWRIRMLRHGLRQANTAN